MASPLEVEDPVTGDSYSITEPTEFAGSAINYVVLGLMVLVGFSVGGYLFDQLSDLVGAEEQTSQNVIPEV